jgi:hypothetical protein
MTRPSTDTSVDGCARIRPSLQCFVNEIATFDTLSGSLQQGTLPAAEVNMIVGGRARNIPQRTEEGRFRKPARLSPSAPNIHLQ